MADVRTYLKTSGQTGTPSLRRVDSTRVRVDWRDRNGSLITSQVMTDAEARQFATDYAAFIEAPAPEPTPPDALSPALLSAGTGDGKLTLNWFPGIGTVARWEVWINDAWAAELPADARTWEKTGLTNGQALTARVVAYDAAGNYANSNVVSVTVEGPVAPPAPTPEPVPKPEPPGSTMPTDEPTGWRRIFADDFANGLDPAKWTAYPLGWTDTSKHGIYDPSTITVQDGLLDMHIHTRDGKPRVAAPCPILPAPAVTAQPHGIPYSSLENARVTVRMRSDKLPGYKTAWLWWPSSGVWPRDGEIDFPEGDLDGMTAKAFMHRQGATSGSDQDYWDSGVTLADGNWHTFTVEWRMGRSCQFFADGKASPLFTSRVPATPMRYVLQTETELLPSPVPDPAVSGHVQVDWVTVAVPA